MSLQLGDTVYTREITLKSGGEDFIAEMKFKAPKDTHYVVLLMGRIPKKSKITADEIMKRLAAMGYVPSPKLKKQIANGKAAMRKAAARNAAKQKAKTRGK